MPLQLYEKEQILDACFSVFVRNGYANTSTTMLAEAAGISKALIFHHFKSKKALYLSILARCFEQMAPEVEKSTTEDSQDFFEAKGKSGFLRVDYLRKHPEVNKIMLEAFYETPDELRDDIAKFQTHMEETHGALHAAKDKRMRQLFENVRLREGVDREQAYELINIIMYYFNKKYLSVLADEIKMQDEAFWKSFFDKKNSFLDMLRYGIEEKYK